MELGRLVLAIMTVDRDPPYVHQALASLLAADPLVHDLQAVHLMIGSSNAEYLSCYRHHELLTFHPLSEDEQEEIQDWTVHRKFCHNYVRCLGLPIPDGGGICVCEDDIVFRDRFLQRLLLAVNEMENEAGLRDYCLALFSEADFENEPSFYRGKHYCSYGCDYHGTQCMYYPRDVARDLRDFLEQHGVEAYRKPGDLLIAELYGDRMYACPRGLVDHMGVQSTGLGGSGRSPSFARPYQALSREDWGRFLLQQTAPHLSKSQECPSTTPIPKVFHRIWVGQDPLPNTAEALAASWLRHHPDWEMRLWTDENMPAELVNGDIYGQTMLPAQKADLLRHELLYLYGGVYIDIDFECLRKIEPIIDGATYFYGDELPGRPNIALLGCTPRHPFTKWCLARLRDNWPWTPGHILADTGPEFLHRAILGYLGEHSLRATRDPVSGRESGNDLLTEGKPPLRAFHPWVFYPYYLEQEWVPTEHADAYAVHHWQQNWEAIPANAAQPERTEGRTAEPEGRREQKGDELRKRVARFLREVNGSVIHCSTHHNTPDDFASTLADGRVYLRVQPSTIADHVDNREDVALLVVDAAPAPADVIEAIPSRILDRTHTLAIRRGAEAFDDKRLRVAGFSPWALQPEEQDLSFYRRDIPWARGRVHRAKTPGSKNVRLLIIANIEVLRRRMDKSLFHRYQAVALHDNVTLTGPGCAGFVDGMPVSELFEQFGRPDFIIHGVDIGSKGRPLVAGLDAVNIPTAMELVDTWENPAQQQSLLNELAFDYGFHAPRPREESYEESCPNTRFVWTPSAVRTDIFRDYDLPKRYDVLFYGELCEWYPLRLRLHRLLERAGEKNWLRVKLIPHPGYADDGYTPRDTDYVGEKLARAINMAWISIATCSVHGCLFSKHLEIPASKCLAAGSVPDQARPFFGAGFADLSELSDSDIIDALHELLRDKASLQDRIEEGHRRITAAFSVDRYAKELLDLVGSLVQAPPRFTPATTPG